MLREEDLLIESPDTNQRQLGDQWIDSCASAVLEVRSTIVSFEHNYLLNPQHSDFTGAMPQNAACGPRAAKVRNADYAAKWITSGWPTNHPELDFAFQDAKRTRGGMGCCRYLP